MCGDNMRPQTRVWGRRKWTLVMTMMVVSAQCVTSQQDGNKDATSVRSVLSSEEPHAEELTTSSADNSADIVTQNTVTKANTREPDETSIPPSNTVVTRTSEDSSLPGVSTQEPAEQSSTTSETTDQTATDNYTNEQRISTVDSLASSVSSISPANDVTDTMEDRATSSRTSAPGEDVEDDDDGIHASNNTTSAREDESAGATTASLVTSSRSEGSLASTSVFISEVSVMSDTVTASDESTVSWSSTDGTNATSESSSVATESAAVVTSFADVTSEPEATDTTATILPKTILHTDSIEEATTTHTDTTATAGVSNSSTLVPVLDYTTGNSIQNTSDELAKPSTSVDEDNSDGQVTTIDYNQITNVYTSTPESASNASTTHEHASDVDISTQHANTTNTTNTITYAPIEVDHTTHNTSFLESSTYTVDASDTITTSGTGSWNATGTSATNNMDTVTVLNTTMSEVDQATDSLSDASTLKDTYSFTTFNSTWLYTSGYNGSSSLDTSTLSPYENNTGYEIYITTASMVTSNSTDATSDNTSLAETSTVPNTEQIATTQYINYTDNNVPSADSSSQIPVFTSVAGISETTSTSTDQNTTVTDAEYTTIDTGSSPINTTDSTALSTDDLINMTDVSASTAEATNETTTPTTTQASSITTTTNVSTILSTLLPISTEQYNSSFRISTHPTVDSTPILSTNTLDVTDNSSDVSDSIEQSSVSPVSFTLPLDVVTSIDTVTPSINVPLTDVVTPIDVVTLTDVVTPTDVVAYTENVTSIDVVTSEDVTTVTPTPDPHIYTTSAYDIKDGVTSSTVVTNEPAVTTSMHASTSETASLNYDVSSAGSTSGTNTSTTISTNSTYTVLASSTIATSIGDSDTIPTTLPQTTQYLTSASTSSQPTTLSTTDNPTTSPSTLTTNPTPTTSIILTTLHPSTTTVYLSSSDVITSSTNPSTVFLTPDRSTVTTLQPPAPTINQSEALSNFWLKTVLAVDSNVDVSAPQFLADLEMRLAKTYELGYKRLAAATSNNEQSSDRRRRAATNGDTAVQVIEVARDPASTENTDVVHIIERGGGPADAQTASEAMATLSPQEQAIRLGYVVVSPSQPYSGLPTEEPDSDDNRKWYILGFTLGGVVLLAFIVWLILFIYCKCRGPRRRKGRPSSSRPRSASSANSTSDRGGAAEERERAAKKADRFRGFDVARTTVGMESGTHPPYPYPYPYYGHPYYIPPYGHHPIPPDGMEYGSVSGDTKWSTARSTAPLRASSGAGGRNIDKRSKKELEAQRKLYEQQRRRQEEEECGTSGTSGTSSEQGSQDNDTDAGTVDSSVLDHHHPDDKKLLRDKGKQGSMGEDKGERPLPAVRGKGKGKWGREEPGKHHHVGKGKKGKKHKSKRDDSRRPDAVDGPAGDDDGAGEVVRSTSHQVRLPPLIQSALVNERLQQTAEEEESLRESLQQKADMERMKNKERLRQTKGSKVSKSQNPENKKPTGRRARLRAQRQIAAILGDLEDPDQTSTNRDVPAVFTTATTGSGAGSSKNSQGSSSETGSDSNPGSFEMKQLSHSEEEDGGMYSSPYQTNSLTQSLDDTRTRIHSLIDEAFALANPAFNSDTLRSSGGKWYPEQTDQGPPHQPLLFPVANKKAVDRDPYKQWNPYEASDVTAQIQKEQQRNPYPVEQPVQQIVEQPMSSAPTYHHPPSSAPPAAATVDQDAIRPLSTSSNEQYRNPSYTHTVVDGMSSPRYGPFGLPESDLDLAPTGPPVRATRPRLYKAVQEDTRGDTYTAVQMNSKMFNRPAAEIPVNHRNTEQLMRTGSSTTGSLNQTGTLRSSDESYNLQQAMRHQQDQLQVTSSSMASTEPQPSSYLRDSMDGMPSTNIPVRDSTPDHLRPPSAPPRPSTRTPNQSTPTQSNATPDYKRPSSSIPDHLRPSSVTPDRTSTHSAMSSTSEGRQSVLSDGDDEVDVIYKIMQPGASAKPLVDSIRLDLEQLEHTDVSTSQA